MLWPVRPVDHRGAASPVGGHGVPLATLPGRGATVGATGGRIGHTDHMAMIPIHSAMVEVALLELGQPAFEAATLLPLLLGRRVSREQAGHHRVNVQALSA